MSWRTRRTLESPLDSRIDIICGAGAADLPNGYDMSMTSSGRQISFILGVSVALGFFALSSAHGQDSRPDAATDAVSVLGSHGEDPQDHEVERALDQRG